MQLFLLRHGESELNAKNTHQHPETPLSPQGREQAALVGRHLRQFPIEAIQASPFTRAQETAEIVGSQLDQPVETLDLLAELRTPSEVRGRHTDDPEVLRIKQLMIDHTADPHWRYSNEEKLWELKDRADSFLRQLESRPEQTLLAVSHGGFIRMTAAVIIHGERAVEHYRDMDKIFPTQNTSYALYDFLPEGWKIRHWNQTPHLD